MKGRGYNMSQLNNLEIIVEKLNKIEDEELKKEFLDLITEYKAIKKENVSLKKEIGNDKLLSQISRYA